MSRYSSFGIYLMLIVGLATYTHSHEGSDDIAGHIHDNTKIGEGFNENNNWYLVVNTNRLKELGLGIDDVQNKENDYKGGDIILTPQTILKDNPPPEKESSPTNPESTVGAISESRPTVDDTPPIDTTEDTSEETTDQDSDDSYEPPSIPQRVDEQAVATREPPKIKITHIEHWQDEPFVWIIYVLNDERRFVSTAYIVLEIWNPEELASGDGQPKFSASLPREGRFAYQGVHRKHAYFTSPTGERANNAFLVASKKTFQNWNHRERHVKFAITSPHEQRVVYQKGDVFVLRDWKTKEIISQFPEPAAEEDAVPAAPIKPEINRTYAIV